MDPDFTHRISIQVARILYPDKGIQNSFKGFWITLKDILNLEGILKYLWFYLYVAISLIRDVFEKYFNIHEPIIILTIINFIFPFVSTAPTEPLNVKIIQVTLTSLSVSWQKPRLPNGMIRKYTIKYWNGSNIFTQRLTSSLNNESFLIVLENLKPLSEYKIMVKNCCS